MNNLIRLSKEDFNAGSAFSCWLKEELVGEISNHLAGYKGRGLIKKHNVRVDNKTIEFIMSITKFDDLYGGLKQIAIEIIKMELDKDFKP